jgi:hypothetical protein
VSWIIARAVKVGLVVTIALGVAAYLSQGLRAILLDAYLVSVAGVFLLALVRTTGVKAPAEGSGAAFEAAIAGMRRRVPDTGEPALTRELELSTLSALHLHVRVRPVLRMIAGHRLSAHYGVELDAEPARARELVPSATWELVRPDRPPPADRLAAGPPLDRLAVVVTELEAL